MTKEQGRAELHHTIWQNANELTKDFNYSLLSDKEAEFGQADTVKELNKGIARIVTKQNKLCNAIDEIVADIEGVR